MKMCRFKCICLLSVAWTLMVCLGCFNQVPSTAYYTLNPMVEKNGAGPVANLGQRVIGVGPLTLPDYLDRPSIVTRISPNQVAVNEGYRWAGTLQSEILRVITANLETLTNAKQVVAFPWGIAFEPDIRIRINIQAFEGNRDGKAQLKAAWTLTPGQGKQPAIQRVSQIETKVLGENFDNLAQAMGKLLADLSRQMAEAISKDLPSTSFQQLKPNHS